MQLSSGRNKERSAEDWCTSLHPGRRRRRENLSKEEGRKRRKTPKLLGQQMMERREESQRRKRRRRRRRRRAGRQCSNAPERTPFFWQKRSRRRQSLSSWQPGVCRRGGGTTFWQKVVMVVSVRGGRGGLRGGLVPVLLVPQVAAVAVAPAGPASFLLLFLRLFVRWGEAVASLVRGAGTDRRRGRGYVSHLYREDRCDMQLA